MGADVWAPTESLDTGVWALPFVCRPFGARIWAPDTVPDTANQTPPTLGQNLKIAENAFQDILKLFQAKEKKWLKIFMEFETFSKIGLQGLWGYGSNILISLQAKMRYWPISALEKCPHTRFGFILAPHPLYPRNRS